MTMNESEDSSELRWGAVATMFGLFGRGVLLLDDNFVVVRATENLDAITCKGTAERCISRPLQEVVGGPLFDATGPLRRGLAGGRRIEGRRAFIRCSTGALRMMSVSVAAMPDDMRLLCDPRAHYVMVVRDVEDPSAVSGGGNHTWGLVARSPAMLQIVSLVEAMYASDATVLITGESGTGKEVVARALHEHSPRREEPFVAINCAGLPEGLLESELFGHARGAFTGALTARRGRFEAAENGTVFLDEIGDMPLSSQAKLLRVLQEGTYERLGEEAPRRLSARVVAATNADLEAAVRSDRFRADLYYRLRVVPVHIPPLRHRVEDVEILAHHLLHRISASAGRALILSSDTLAVLLSYPWPGNVRELENALRHAVALCGGQTLQVEHLPQHVRLRGSTTLPSADHQLPAGAGVECGVGSGAGVSAESGAGAVASPSGSAGGDSDSELDEKAIRAALDSHRWNRSRAAAALGISRATLWRKMRGLKIS